MILNYNTREELEEAIYEAALLQVDNYKNLNFLNKVFRKNINEGKQSTYITEQVKHLILKNKSPKTIYNFMLESGCASKYDDLAEYMDFPKEEDILFDLEEDHDWGGYYEDNDLDDFDSDDEDDDMVTDYFLNKNDDRTEDLRDFPNEWIAEKAGKKMTFKLPLNEGDFDMSKFKNEVLRLEKEGYKVTAIEKKKLNEEQGEHPNFNRISVIKSLISGSGLNDYILYDKIISTPVLDKENLISLKFKMIIPKSFFIEKKLKSEDQYLDFITSCIRNNEEYSENENNISIKHYDVSFSSHEFLDNVTAFIYVLFSFNNNLNETEESKDVSFLTDPKKGVEYVLSNDYLSYLIENTYYYKSSDESDDIFDITFKLRIPKSEKWLRSNGILDANSLENKMNKVYGSKENQSEPGGVFKRTYFDVGENHQAYIVDISYSEAYNV